MRINMKKLLTLGAIGLSFSALVQAKTELTMYYPVSVGGALTKVVDSIVEDFEQENPDIDVKAIYAGNYNDARVKALAALNSGQPAQLSARLLLLTMLSQHLMNASGYKASTQH